MRNILNIAFIVSGIIPATFLLFMCLYIFNRFFTASYEDPNLTLAALNSLLGVLGYVGLILLIFEHKVKSWVILICLSIGITSWMIFISLNGERAWNWIITIEDPLEWLLIVWPLVVAIFSVIRIVIQMIRNLKAIE